VAAGARYEKKGVRKRSSAWKPVPRRTILSSNSSGRKSARSFTVPEAEAWKVPKGPSASTVEGGPT
jgi:hypothetical protein